MTALGCPGPKGALSYESDIIMKKKKERMHINYIGIKSKVTHSLATSTFWEGVEM